MKEYKKNLTKAVKSKKKKKRRRTALVQDYACERSNIFYCVYLILSTL